MATMNPFDLLGDDDNEDPSLVIVPASVKTEKPKKAAAAAPQAKPAKPAQLPTKPPPPSQAVKEARNGSGRGGGRGGRGRGRGGREFNRDSSNNADNGFSGGFKPSEEGDAGKPTERRSYGGPRGGYRGNRRGGFDNGESGEGERPHRAFERRSGTGRGNEFKRDGSGRGNWGTPTDEVAPEIDEAVAEAAKNIDVEGQPGDAVTADDATKESPANEAEEKGPQDKEMTLQEYEKILEEKRKALLALKIDERKVDKKVFESMQQLSNKKQNDEIFIKLGSEKDKRKDAADKEERAKKSVSINEFLKPAEGESYNSRGGRGRGRGRGSRGVYGGNARDVAAPSIEDPGQFPTLGGK